MVYVPMLELNRVGCLLRNVKFPLEQCFERQAITDNRWRYELGKS